MESLVNFQDELSKRIFKARQNFKKSPKERITKVYVETRLESLEQIWAEFRQGHRELMQGIDTSILKQHKYITDGTYDTTEDEFTNYKCELKIYLEAFLKKDARQVSENNGQANVRSSLVKLPKISIPIFSGKYTEWTTFKDLFVSMIDKNDSLDSVQKLQYLKGYLSGEAEQLIRYIPVTEANYEKCWQALKERYSNKKYLSHCILKRLLSQRNATVESASFLKELMDTSSDCLSALSNLGIDVSTWDIIVIHLLSLKLDPESRKQWELNVTMNVTSDDLPTFDQFKKFLTSRYRALEFIEPKSVSRPTTSHAKPATVSHTKVLHTANVSKLNCEYCNEGHKLCFCRKFANLNYEKRHEFVTKNRICYNCLGGNHGVRFCQKTTTCRICKKKHHSLLHPSSAPTSTANLGKPVQTVEEVTGEVGEASNESGSSHIASHMACSNVSTQVLLATALIDVQGKTGYQRIRALLDQGSQASFVTEDTVQRLGLKRIPIKNVISGLGGDKSTVSKYMVSLKIKSRTEPNFAMELRAYVLSSITTYLPGKRVQLEEWVELHQLCLADPAYDVPNKIDVLLGAEVYCQILKEGVRRGPMGSPIAQCTTLGWVLSGAVHSERGQHSIAVLHAHVEEDEILKRFWELESEPVVKTKLLTQEEQRCEDIFAATTHRTEDGRYVVKLPFRDEEPACKNGDSREIAVKRLENLERKFARNVELKQRYEDVINEYIQLGHMALVPKPDMKREQAVYLPHHAVIREDKSTTKVRVVFDASCKNQAGVSLNDTLMVGPTLQPELRHLIMNWRMHPVCLIGDIVKMYRMVRVAEEDSDFQRIVWREDPEKGIRDYKLLTVTFGTASAPYLAVKALNQVAVDHKDQFPLAASRVAKEFYMDDLMTGGQTTEEAWQVYTEMKQLLDKGGFILQKWASNDEALVKQIHEEEREEGVKETKNLEMKDDNTVKILGLTWNRREDEFRYAVKLPALSSPVTKRKIISDISRLFDPLGWIAPCVIKAKAFIQSLWTSGVGWDEEPPAKLLEDWYNYREELAQLNTFRIPRWLNTKVDNLRMELHGFSDASKVAYAGVVYLRVISASGVVHVGLIAAKTRVSPIKQVSIPRLELCGAVLLAKLLIEIAGVLEIPKNNIKAWTDSTVVLAWLNKHPSNWKTFVANRVSEILTTLDSTHWFHVSTKDNPADCASRGLRPAEIANHNLWKFGPDFLSAKDITYSKLKNNETSDEQVRTLHVKVVEKMPFLEKYSSLNKLMRIVAICRRFVTKRDPRNRIRSSSYLSTWELNEALTVCIKLAQRDEFGKELAEIEEKGYIQTKTSKILNLTPFIDEKGVLRVGGRISQSQESEKVKHPIILSNQSYLSKLIVTDAHEKTLHGDIQLMMNYIRSAYYITRAKDAVKHHVSKCVRCIRQKAKLRTQLMGSLPSVRVTPARAFSRSGVDYAGPIGLRTTKGRGHKAYKGYICLFVCMVTRAVHLEVASDLSSRGFLEAFKRFVARRGHCMELYSDNGTNFVGASKELRELFHQEKSTMLQEIRESLATVGTTWTFIPARAPNFGGLWEAGGVWSLKNLSISVPRAVLSGEGQAAVLRCSYDLEGAALYSIRWYRAETEFYRYVPRELPPSLVFPLPGASVDLTQSDENQVRIVNLNRRLSGDYQCEVSADAPLFHTDIRSAPLTVVDPPFRAPRLTVSRGNYARGDVIRAHCTVDEAYPAPNITWILDDHKIAETIPEPVSELDFTERGASSQLEITVLETEQYRVGLTYTSASLARAYRDYGEEKKNRTTVRYAMVPPPSGQFELGCVSTILDIYARKSEPVTIREDAPRPASVTGEDSSGVVVSCSLFLAVCACACHLL